MDGTSYMLAFVLSVSLVIGFFMLVSRAGAIRAELENLRMQSVEQTRYLAAISMNIARERNEKLKGSPDSET
jgi:hypothetical protein